MRITTKTPRTGAMLLLHFNNSTKTNGRNRFSGCVTPKLDPWAIRPSIAVLALAIVALAVTLLNLL